MNTREWIMQEIVRAQARKEVLEDMLRTMDAGQKTSRAANNAATPRRVARPAPPQGLRQAPQAGQNAGHTDTPEPDSEYIYPSGFWTGQAVTYNPPRDATPRYPINGINPGTPLAVIDPPQQSPEDGVWVTDGQGSAMIDAMCLAEG